MLPKKIILFLAFSFVFAAFAGCERSKFESAEKNSEMMESETYDNAEKSSEMAESEIYDNAEKSGEIDVEEIEIQKIKYDDVPWDESPGDFTDELDIGPETAVKIAEFLLTENDPNRLNDMVFQLIEFIEDENIYVIHFWESDNAPGYSISIAIHSKTGAVLKMWAGE
ncbi:MAG: hypothetical protein LBS21_07535 [Clostridiales bacterium]|jgi:hypothetical protein|nr:hypothetical protein [Clostridiales bacterium]